MAAGRWVSEADPAVRMPHLPTINVNVRLTVML